MRGSPRILETGVERTLFVVVVVPVESCLRTVLGRKAIAGLPSAVPIVAMPIAVNWRSVDFLSLLLEVPLLVSQAVVVGLTWNQPCAVKPLRDWLLVSCCTLAVIIPYSIYIMIVFPVNYAAPMERYISLVCFFASLIHVACKDTVEVSGKCFYVS
jgi:hypothetical protein